MTFEEFIYYKEQKADGKATKRTQKSTLLDSIYDLLEEHGEIPLALKETLDKIDDIDLLRKYLKAAAKAESIQAFMDSMD